MYVNQVMRDRGVLVEQGVLTFARKQFGTETWRPPGYRLVAAPVALVTGGSPPTLRLTSLATLVLTVILLLAAGREIGGVPTGITWALGGGLAVGTYGADLWFGTEVPLFPAIGAALLGAARVFERGKADRFTCFLLFIAAALGGLAKLSFFVIFGPIAVATWWFGAGSRTRIATSVAAGLLLISPWWLFNWRDALGYASYASAFVRHNYPWASSAATDLLGIPFTIGLTATLLWSITRLRTTTVARPGPARAMILTCLGGVIPITVLHAMGSNHNMRLLSPAWFPAAGIIAMALFLTGAFASRAGQAITAVVFVAQAAMLSVRTWQRTAPQRDWAPLRTMIQGLRPEQIRIAHLGETGVLNAPQIEHAWRVHGELIDVDRMWRWEKGPIDWSETLARVDSAVAVVIPIGIVVPKADSGRSDNAHNEDLIARLLAAPDIWKADTLPPTPLDTISYVVFRRR
jgi:hypothetical protein